MNVGTVKEDEIIRVKADLHLDLRDEDLIYIVVSLTPDLTGLELKKYSGKTHKFFGYT